MKLTAAEQKELRLKRKFTAVDKQGRYFVTDKWSRAFYPATENRLNEVCRDNRLGLKVKAKRSPRLAHLVRPNGKSLQTDRLWCKVQCLQEAAEIIHTLLSLDKGGKVKYYNRLGL